MSCHAPSTPTDRRDCGRHRRSLGTRWPEWSPLTATARQAQSVRLCHRYRTADDCQRAFDFGAKEFVDLENDGMEGVGGPDPVFDDIGGDIQMRSAGVFEPEERCDHRRTGEARPSETAIIIEPVLMRGVRGQCRKPQPLLPNV